MKAPKSEVYSTQFVSLSPSEGTKHKKLKKFLYILIVSISLLFCIKIGYFCYKSIFAAFHSNGENNSSTSPVVGTQLQNQKTPSFSIFSSNLWSSVTVKKRTENDSLSEYSGIWCEDIDHLQAIPAGVINSNNERFFPKTMQDFMIVDLLLYYERIINEYDWRHLKGIFNDYRNKLVSVEKREDLIDFFDSLESNKFKYYSAYLKGNDYDLQMDGFRKCFSLTEDLYHWYNYLDDFWIFLSDPKRQKMREDYRIDVTEKNFYKFTRETQMKMSKSQHSFEYTEKKSEELNEVLNAWTRPVKIILSGSSIIFYNKALLLSEVRMKLSSLNVSKMDSLYIFASSTLYLDEDLTLFGVNVAMIAPDWVFLKEITINLNGSNGEEYKNKTSKGEPGRPGKAGGNAGDFFAVGNINRKYLKVSCDGGHGGSGENGVKGRDSINSSFPFTFPKNPNCKIKINTYYNPVKQKITHYKIFDERGCGRPGTDGGVGGVGGKGGRIVIINKKLEISEGVSGLSGRPGKGGKGGSGALTGCYFEAFLVDDEFLHRISRIKCTNDTLPSGKSGKDGTNAVGQELGHNKNYLNLSDALFEFVLIAGEDLKRNDSVLVSFLNDLSERDFIYSLTDPMFLSREFKLIENLDDSKLLLTFINKIDGYLRLPWYHNSNLLNHLKSLVLGKLLLLKENVNYYFTDLNSYLNILRRNIESVDENTIRRYPSVTVLNKKVDHKLIKITMNLKMLKDKLKILQQTNGKLIQRSLQQHDSKGIAGSEFSKSLGDRIQERRILCVASMVTNILVSFVNLTRFHPLNAEDELRFRNFVTNEMSTFEKFKKHLFDSLTVSFPQNVIGLNSYEYFEEFLTIEKRISQNLNYFSNADFKIFQSRGIVQAVKTDFEFLTGSAVLHHEGRIIMEAIVDEIEHFIILYQFIERHELKNSFLMSLNRLQPDDENDEEIRPLRRRLYETYVTLLYNLAIDGIQQRFYPFIQINRHLESNLSGSIKDEALIRINNLYEISKQSSLCTNHHEAFFDKTSTVGEFYYWPNADIKNKLINLFNGEEIIIKSDLNNRHVLDKNFIRFKNLRLEFECSRNVNVSHCEDDLLRDILNNFKIEITHSGYSYHSWKGETVVIVSDEVTFDYSLKVYKNGEPEVYNSIIKKFENGGIMLSPYTTWMIQLLPINELANYTHLMSLVNDINLRLVGTGTFIPSLV